MRTLTAELLRQCTSCSEGDAKKYAGPLDAAMAHFGIGNDLRQTAFLAQLAHESGRLRYVEENLNYSSKALLGVFKKYFNEAQAFAYQRHPEKIANRVYGGRMGNGPEDSGDGWKYRGRGLIQLTGRNNYAACGKALDYDLLDCPDLLIEPEPASMSAAWFWSSRGLNELADEGEFETITKRINGGLNGWMERLEYWRRAKAAYGIS